MIRRLWIAALLVCLAPVAMLAKGRASGWCENGNVSVVMQGSGQTSGPQKFMQSYPSCTVTVYAAGTTTVVTIFADNAGTVKANPFSASTSGQWFFYADNGAYDVRLSGGGIPSPYTLGGVDVMDPVSGAGITGRIPVWSTNTDLGNSNMTSAGATVGVNIGPVDDPVRDIFEVYNAVNDSTRLTVRNGSTGSGAEAAVVIRDGPALTNNAGSLGVTSTSFNPAGSLLPNQFYILSASGASNGINVHANAGPIVFGGNEGERQRLTSDPFLQLTASYTGTNRCTTGTVGLRNNAGILEKCENAGAWTAIGSGGTGGGGITITGTPNANNLTKWTGASSVGNSSITDNGTVVALTALPTISTNAILFANSSKQISTDEGFFNYDSTNHRLYFGFGPMTDLTGTTELVVSGTGGILTCTANSNASCLNMNVVSGVAASLNSGRTGTGTRLPFVIYTNAQESLRLTTDPFFQLTTSYAGSNLCQTGAVAFRNNAGAIETCQNGGAWTPLGASTGTGVSGSGTANLITKWTSSSVVGNSTIIDDGTNITFSSQPTIVNNAIAFVNSSKQLKTDEGFFNYDSTNHRLYFGFGPMTDVTGTTELIVSGAGGVLTCTANSNASCLNMNAVSGSFTSLNSGRTGTGARLPFVMFTGAAETMRLHTSNNVSIGSNIDNGLKFEVTGNVGFTGTTMLNGRTYTWPATEAASQCLQTNGSGVLSWNACGTGTTSSTGVVDIISHGAVCDGATDDTVAIQNSINVAFSTGGVRTPLYINPSNAGCVVSAALTLPAGVAPFNIIIFGQGTASTIRRKTAGDIFNLSFNGGGSNYIHDVRLMGDVGGVVGLELSGTLGTNSHNEFRNITFSGVEVGILVSKTSTTAPEVGFDWNVFDSLDFNNNPNGVSGNVPSMNAIRFVHGSGTGNVIVNGTCVIGNGSTAGTCIDYPGDGVYNVGDITISNWQMATTGGTSINFGSAPLYKANISITNSQFEGTGTSIRMPAGYSAITMLSNNWGGGTTSAVDNSIPGTIDSAFGSTASFSISGGKTLIVNKNSSAPPANALALDTVGWFAGANGQGGRVLLDVYGNNGAFTCRRANNTAAAPSPVVSGDILCGVVGAGRGATTFTTTPRGGLFIQAAENWSDAATGTNLVFQVTPNLTTTGVNSTTMHNSGDFLVGAATPDNIAQHAVLVQRDQDLNTLAVVRNGNVSANAFAGFTARSGASGSSNDITIGVLSTATTGLGLPGASGLIRTGTQATGGLTIQTQIGGLHVREPSTNTISMEDAGGNQFGSLFASNLQMSMNQLSTNSSISMNDPAVCSVGSCIQLETGPSGSIFVVDENDNSITATNIQLYHNGTLKRVEVGPLNSGGPGFRYLRIVN